MDAKQQSGRALDPALLVSVSEALRDGPVQFGFGDSRPKGARASLAPAASPAFLPRTPLGASLAAWLGVNARALCALAAMLGGNP